MSSISQFVCGAAVGVAVVVTVTRIRNYLNQEETEIKTQQPQPSIDYRSNGISQESLTQERVLHTIQSAVTPMRAQPEESIEDEDTAASVSGSGVRRENDCQSILNLLYNIAEDQAKKEGFVHRGITCNTCQTSPICGVRYKCANCVDYDICERCEAQDCHNRTHVFLKIMIPIPPLANPRTPCTNVLYPGTGRLEFIVSDPFLLLLFSRIFFSFLLTS